MKARIRGSELVRALVLLGVGVILGLLMGKPHDLYPFTVVGWGLFVVFELALVAGAVRIVRLEAIEPDDHRFVFRTRELSVFTELGIGVFGVIGLLLLTSGYIAAFGTEFDPPGPAWHPRSHAMDVILGTVCGLFIGLPAVFFRPAFVLDLEEGTLHRYPFGRALPVRSQALQPSVLVVAEGYYAGSNPRIRIGFMIRGRTAAGNFELELVRTQDPAVVAERERYWQDAMRRLGISATAEPHEG
ncbi:hypothetical protein [Paraliomyxa miuraensis]|uniref:hypothetical protein n=1 Tax=Paraliomyxa miuraensis TaxID=376150 RepID=UPI00225AD9C4|nr:hypothetical protein [Paraliomyxa miuraensis]MCX4242983.1 hypothetical protein [Paraliomyxa miuraensis]